MHKIFPLFLIFVFLSCSTTNEKFEKDAFSLLNKEREELQQEIDYRNNFLKIAALNFPNDRKQDFFRDVFHKTKQLVAELKAEINKENYSKEKINILLKDPLITKYSYGEKFDFSIIDFDNDSLNKLQKEVEFLSLEKQIYFNLYAKIMGCSSFSPPFLITIPDEKEVNVLYGILDTSYRPNKFFIDSVTLNGKKINDPITIDCTHGYCSVLFNSDKPGNYRWYGGYTFSLMNWRQDTLPATGQFDIKEKTATQ